MKSMDLVKDQFLKNFENTKNGLGQVLQSLKNAKSEGNLSKIATIELAIERMNDEIDRINNYWFLDDTNINEQFKRYSENRINSMLLTCRRMHSSFCSNTSGDFSRCVGFATEMNSIIGDKSSNELFSNFKYGDCNYILFGKNGAGKTTLINELVKIMFESNSAVIRAARNINYNQNQYFSDSEVNLKNALTSSDGKSIFLLAKEILKKEIEYDRLEEKSGTPMNRLVENTFNSLGLNRKLKIASDAGLTLTLDDGSGEYSFSDASDGEKSAFYFISTAFLAPKNSYLIIDEPENHLNGSLMIKLFDLLESERKDLTFVYATHNLHFIESRNNVEIIYLKKIDERNRWEFNKFDDYGDLTLDTILTVEGTNDDVIFCEGENMNSLDCKLYGAMYPNYQIIPSGGCDKVVSKTFIFNDNANTFRKKAYGIVDYDFRQAEDIQRLKDKSVFVSKLNEIENYYLLEPFLKAGKEQFLIEDSVEDIKNKIINIISYKKDEVLRDFATKAIRRINLKNQLSDIHDVENSIDELNRQNKTLFLSEFGSFESKLNDALTNKEYEKLMILVPGKKFYVDAIRNSFNINKCDTYINLCIKRVGEDTTVRDALKQYISPDFN